MQKKITNLSEVKVIVCSPFQTFFLPFLLLNVWIFLSQEKSFYAQNVALTLEIAVYLNAIV